MSKNRLKNLVIIFICIIAMVATFAMKMCGPSFEKKTEEADKAQYLNENQLKNIDDSLYNEEASDE